VYLLCLKRVCWLDVRYSPSLILAEYVIPCRVRLLAEFSTRRVFYTSPSILYLAEYVYSPSMCTRRVCVLTEYVYSPSMCTRRVCVLAEYVYSPSMCTHRVCVLAEYVVVLGEFRNSCSRGVCSLPACGSEVKGAELAEVRCSRRV